MEAIVRFIVTTVDGKQELQELPFAPNKIVEGIMAAMIQYAQLGVLKQGGNKFTLLPASQIRLVEAEIPLVVGASALDTVATAKAAEDIKKILS